MTPTPTPTAIGPTPTRTPRPSASPTKTPKPDFVLSKGSVQETVYTLSSGNSVPPISCQNLSSDSYLWKLKLAKITDNFGEDLAKNVIIVAFGGSCEPISDVTNTLEIPPGAVSTATDSNGIVTASFSAAVPDFNSYNSSGELPYFDEIDFQMVYNPTKSAAEGLKPGAGTLEVSGNANLCNILPEPQQCFILDLAYGADSGADLGCLCVTPTVTEVDISSIFEP